MNKWFKQARRRVRHGEIYASRARAVACAKELRQLGADVTTEGVRLFWRAQGMWFRRFSRRAA